MCMNKLYRIIQSIIHSSGTNRSTWSYQAAKAFNINLLVAIWLLGTSLSAPAVEPPTTSPPLFTDISQASGLDFVHFNGMFGEFYLPEITGQGGALLDYDNDGDLDVYLVQGCMLGPGKTVKDTLIPPRDPVPRDRLFRNDLKIGPDGERTIRFVDVTDESGLKAVGYGMGASAADFNNDGFVDLYVTNYGPNQMYYNNGDGTFTDVTARTGTGDELWSTSVGVLDYDRDGRLDIYVANYVVFDVNKNPKCYAKSSRRDFCGPSAFPPDKDRLYHNRGDGTFEDVSKEMLLDYVPGSGLGVVTFDANGDGWIDIYVANDGNANNLWINDGGQGFIDDALFAGAAVNYDGLAEAGMGVSATDYDGDGDEDLFMTHIMGETHTLYINEGDGLFEDRTISFGLSAASFPFTTFGSRYIDYDNDGWQDLFVVSGGVLTIERLARQGDIYPLHQPNQVFRNENGKKFVDVTELAGKDIAISEVSRGAIYGDIDNDGDEDVVVCNNSGKVRLFQNNVGHLAKWLGVRAVDSEKKRDMLGAFLGLKRKGKPDLWRRVRVDASFCSSNDPRIIFGLGDSEQVDEIEIQWPDGTTEVWKNPVPMTYTTLVQGAVNEEVEK